MSNEYAYYRSHQTPMITPQKRQKKLIKDFLFEKKSYLIGDACKEVWKQFGGAFKESVVDKALDIALTKRGLELETQKRIDIFFEGKKVGTYVPDKVINEAILIEVKCKPILTQEDKKQFWYYLKATEYKLGFLVNFGPRKLEIFRRVYDKARNKPWRNTA